MKKTSNKQTSTLLNKRVVVIFSICLLALAGTVWLTTEKHEPKEGEIKAGLDSASFLKDSSGDGMYDWEKSLWGLDPLKNDFSGDGIPDVEKIKMGRDPRLVYPDDELEEVNIPAYMRTYENPTQTEAFIEEYWKNFREMASNNKLTEEELFSMLQKMLETHGTERDVERITKNTYGFADIKSVPSSSESLHKYGNSLGQLLKEYSSRAEFNELVLIQTALETGDKDILQGIEENIPLYEEAVANLLETEVPEGLESDHLKVLNALTRLRHDAGQMKENIFEDPLAGLLDIDYYQKNLLEYTVVASSVQEYLFLMGIEYASDEPGYFFMEFDFGFKE